MISNRYFFFCIQDGHEICFVGDEAFRELSKVDPNGDELLNTVSISRILLESLSNTKPADILRVTFYFSVLYRSSRRIFNRWSRGQEGG